jgi:hypothetical protein
VCSAEIAELPLILRLTSRLAAPSATVSRLIGTTVLRFVFDPGVGATIAFAHRATPRGAAAPCMT